MSITGQVGHVSFAKQDVFGTEIAIDGTTGNGNFKPIKITGDSLVANNNMLVAEGEIGTGRDVSSAIPGGFSSAGAINGNLRARAAAVLLEGALGVRTEVAAVTGPPAYIAHDSFTPGDTLPVFTVEKKVGTTGSQLLVLHYVDTMVNTLNISVPTGGFATFSAGLIACSEKEVGAAVSTENYPASGDQTLAFHGGRIRLADKGTTLTSTYNDSAFQNMELAINNNIQADEYTIRPSRFLRGLTEGIRSIEANMTIIFDDKAKYERYTYSATGNTQPGYSLYEGNLQLFLGNWQIADADILKTTAPTGAPGANIQGMEFDVPDLAFGGFPVALAAGRIAVQTTARALKSGSNNIMTARVRPQRAGIDYATAILS